MLDALLEEFSSPFGTANVAVAAARLLGAMLLAGIVGLEREWRDKPAGLRTHMLVALAACLFVQVGQQLSYVPINDAADLQVGPLRLIEAVTAGVAFMAAGVIFTSRGRVRNLKTGASLWMAGATGVACGAGQMPLAALATGIVVCVMVVVRRVEKWMGTY